MGNLGYVFWEQWISCSWDFWLYAQVAWPKLRSSRRAAPSMKMSLSRHFTQFRRRLSVLSLQQFNMRLSECPLELWPLVISPGSQTMAVYGKSEERILAKNWLQQIADHRSGKGWELANKAPLSYTSTQGTFYQTFESIGCPSFKFLCMLICKALPITQYTL